MALRGAHSRGLFDLCRRFILDLSDPNGDLNPAPLVVGVLGGGGCSGAGEAVGGTPSSATVSLQSHSPMLLSWPSTCEKLERWLVCLGTTLINWVDVGPKGGGGGAGGGMGVGVVGAEQRAAASEAW